MLCVLFAGVQLIPFIVNFIYTHPDCASVNNWVPLANLVYWKAIGNVWCTQHRDISWCDEFFWCTFSFFRPNAQVKTHLWMNAITLNWTLSFTYHLQQAFSFVVISPSKVPLYSVFQLVKKCRGLEVEVRMWRKCHGKVFGTCKNERFTVYCRRCTAVRCRP
jgi:hypothetical protein